MNLTTYPALLVKQVHELAELIGFESRNKYEVQDPEGRAIAYAAEQSSGLGGTIARQFLGHWRRFDITLFDYHSRRPFLHAHHPFRWFFQRLEVRTEDGRYLGALQQRFAFFSKSFDVQDAHGRVVLKVSSPFWRIWTFKFTHQGQQRAMIAKKWSGLLAEAFTDKDNFLVDYQDPQLDNDTRMLLLAAALFIDLQYFEKKADS